jgi:tRNA-specific 2-thiouridylase
MARIVVGMSGGVDSSLAAALLAEEGHEVVGVTMKLWPCAELDGGFTREDACCSPTETIDARSVARRVGIAHYVLDLEAAFRAAVVEGFVAGYARGETPNPCVRCNESVKFGDLHRAAGRWNATAVATGHYARVVERDGRYAPALAADPAKDQTYFLFSLTQEQLAAARFPLGGMTKEQVRAAAAARQLPTAAKHESQDICFVGEGGVEGFLRREAPQAFAPGEVRHVDGRRLGSHRGLAAFTIGQRRGLGVAAPEPLYVVDLDPSSQTVVLGPREALEVSTARLRDCTWHLGPLPAGGLACRVRNRHRGTLHPAIVHDDGQGGARITYANPITRPAAGQACVAYADDGVCLGGGWFVRG